MNILIYGHQGWIGQQFLQYLLSLKDDYPDIHLGKARCNDMKEIIKEFDEIKPSHVVSFIGRTHGPGYSTIDYLELPGKLDINVRDNIFSPILLSLLCLQRNIHYTYLGTGCIFEYEDDDVSKTFNESSLPNFKGSSYSLIKGYTDQLFHTTILEQNSLNLRIRMPITSVNHPRNFITKITSYDKICSIPNSMTVLDEFIPMFYDMMKMKVTGTVNCTNPGVISHNEILEMYKEIVDPNFSWKNFSLEEQALILKSGRSNNHLSTERISSLFPNIKPIKESIRDCLTNWKS